MLGFGFQIPFKKVNSSSYDSDAQAFFNAGTFNDDLKTAYNTLFLNLKTGLTNATDVYSDIVAMYILTSGTAADNAINAVNPSTFDLTFVNSPTHASTGVTFNGTTQYARTGLIPNSHLTANDFFAASYQSNNTSDGAGSIGVNTGSTARFRLIPNNGANNIQGQMNTGSTSDGMIQKINGDSSGLTTVSRRSSTDIEAYRNATSLGTETNANVGTLPTLEAYIGALNNSGSAIAFYSQEIRLAFIGNGLSDNQVADLSAACAQLMTDLGI